MHETNCQITIDLTSKQIAQSGEIAIRELVLVTLINGTGAVAADLVLNILDDAGVVMATCNSFAAVGATFVDTLDMSGALLAGKFTGDAADMFHRFALQVFSNESGAQSLLVSDEIRVMNNPFSAAVQAQVVTSA